MPSLAEEVADELQKKSPETVWWRRMVLIIAANALGTLIGGGLLGFCAIVWTKANSTDRLNQQLQANAQRDRVVRDEILLELAKLKVHYEKSGNDEEIVGPLLPSSPAEEPSAEEVEAAKEQIQQRLDKAIYRENQ